MPVVDFGVLQVKAIRTRLVDQDLARSTVNKFMDIVSRVFKWGVEEAMVPVELWNALQTVSGLRAGRSKARDNASVTPISPDGTHLSRRRPPYS